MNISDPIRLHARQRPDAPAVIRTDGTTVTYRGLDRRIDALAGRLLDVGLRPGNTVALAISRPYPFVALAFALARMGVTSAPPTLPAEHTDLRVTEAGTPTGGRTKAIPLAEIWTKGLSPAVAVPAVASHDDGTAVFHIFPSSGTTGNPKHVAITHDMVARRVLSRGLMAPLPDNPVQICTIGFGSHFGFKSLLRVLWAGGLIVLPGKPVAKSVPPLIRRHQVNYLVTSAFTLERIIASLPPEAEPFPSLVGIEFGGSLMPRQVYDLARQRLCARIVSLYGTTESGAIASAPMAELIGHPGAVGRVHRSVEIRTADADGNPLPPAAEGILWVRTDTCVPCYFGDTNASASAFRDGWFCTGDTGTVSGNGLLTLAGRTGELINNGGDKVSPRVIEDVLSSQPGIREAAAFGAPDATGVIRVWAAIVTDGPVDMPALTALCNKRLKHNAPRFIIKMKALPRNDAGKILRDRLIGKAIEGLAAGSRPRAAGNAPGSGRRDSP
jgi:acyl-CoA synthetase (AMP-forming)/AMP-acid ligase II